MYSLTWTWKVPGKSTDEPIQVYHAHCYPYLYTDLKHYLFHPTEGISKIAKVRLACQSQGHKRFLWGTLYILKLRHFEYKHLEHYRHRLFDHNLAHWEYSWHYRCSHSSSKNQVLGWQLIPRGLVRLRIRFCR